MTNGNQFDGANTTMGQCAGNWPCNVFLYLGWVPDHGEDVPFANSSIDRGKLPTSAKLGDGGGGSAAFYVATNPNDLSNWNVLNCTLHNSSYSASFDFSGDQQHITVSNRTLLHSLAAITGADFNYSSTTAINWMYQSIMELMGQLVVGAISYSTEGEDVASRNPIAFALDDIKIIYTNVATSNEMSAIGGPQPFTSSLFNATPSGLSLAEALEDLASNLSLALFSRDEFLMPLDGPTRVKTRTYNNIYAHNRQHLWAAYGTATACTLLSISIAIVAVLRHGATYSNNLSTILRTTHGREYDGVLREDDGGEDPLPEHIARLKIKLGRIDSDTSSSHQSLTRHSMQTNEDLELECLAQDERTESPRL